MTKVKFTDIKVGQVYITRGGTVILDESGKVSGWGYDRVRVIRKNRMKLVIETSWNTTCILEKDYPLSFTREVKPRAEFKLITAYISKQEIPFDDALAQGICTEDVPLDDPAFTKFSGELIKYFSIPQSISSASKHFGVTYHKIRYSIDKIESIGKFKMIRKDMPNGNTVQFIEGK